MLLAIVAVVGLAQVMHCQACDDAPDWNTEGTDGKQICGEEPETLGPRRVQYLFWG